MLQTQSILQEGVEKEGESQTKWIVLALGSRLLIVLTNLLFMRTHCHSYVSLHMKTIFSGQQLFL